MSNATRCDRCRVFRDGEPALTMDLSREMWRPPLPTSCISRIQLCQNCCDDFRAWIAIPECPLTASGLCAQSELEAGHERPIEPVGGG